MTTLICFAPTLTYNNKALTINTAYIKTIEPSFDGKNVCYILLHGYDYAMQINRPYYMVIEALNADDVDGIKLIKV